MEVRCRNGIRIHGAVEQGFRKLYAKECGYSVSTVIQGQEKESQEKSRMFMYGVVNVSTSTARMIRQIE